MYLCNHENNVSSPRLPHNEFVTTHVLGHMTCDVCRRPSGNVMLCIFSPFILNSLLNGYRYQKSRKQKTVRSVSTTSTASEIEFFVIIIYSFNYFSRELCLRCYWVPGSAFGPSPTELVISCRTHWTSGCLSTCHFGVSTKFQSFHQLQMTLKFKL